MERSVSRSVWSELVTGTMSVTGRSGCWGVSSSSAIRVATYSARVRSPRNARNARTSAGPTKIQNHNTRKSLAKRYTSRVFSKLRAWRPGPGMPGLCSVAFLVIALAQGSEPAASPYASRRAELRKALPNGIAVLFGRAETDSDDLRSGFFQEPGFYYLTGWNQPGAVLVIEPSRDILFLPAKDSEAEKWTGTKASAQDPTAP